MSSETPESEAMRAATMAARRVIAASKDARTVLGCMSATGVAFHAADAAIRAYKESLDNGTAGPSVELMRQMGFRPTPTGWADRFGDSASRNDADDLQG